MRFGITMFATDEAMRPDALARAVEERGFDSLWFPEHTHIPASRRTPAPMGEPLPDAYWHTLDPFVALTAAALATSRLRVGTGVCLVAQHDPIVLAKAIASLDLLSGGRVNFGVGYGWNREEMGSHGVDPRTRRERVREHVLAMQRLWTEDEASFQGEFVRFERSWAWPKPVQRPGPPIVIGGAAGPILFGHVAEYGDGWIPVGGSGLTDAIPALRERFEEVDRDPEGLQVVVYGSEPDPAKLEHFAAVGVTEVVFRVPPAPADAVLPVLDEYAGFVRGRS